MNGSGMPTSQVSARFTEFIPISRRNNNLLQLWFQTARRVPFTAGSNASDARLPHPAADENTTVFHRTRAT
jgi:hypothetical protein